MDYIDDSAVSTRMEHHMCNLTEPYDPECGHRSGSTEDILRLIFRGFGVILVSIVGIMMNILSVIVFLRPNMRHSSINILLMGLQISDTIVLCAFLYNVGLRHVLSWYGKGHYVFGDDSVSSLSLPVGFVNYSGLTGSHYFTVVVSLERYVAVCHPLMASRTCSLRRSILAVVIVAVFSMAFTLTFYWDAEIKLLIGFSIFWLSHLAVIQVGPFIALLVLNMTIYIGYRKSQKVLSCMGSTSRTEENSITVQLLSIVVAYLACNSIYVIVVLLHIFSLVQNGWFMDIVGAAFAELLLAVNSGCNFIFYCAFGTKFRNELRQVLKCGIGTVLLDAVRLKRFDNSSNMTTI